MSGQSHNAAIRNDADMGGGDAGFPFQFGDYVSL
jgi:hypothetical protein